MADDFRLRQVCLVANDLQHVSNMLTTALDAPVCVLSLVPRARPSD